MLPSIRPIEPADGDAVVALSLRAWEPVFDSLRGVLAASGVYAELVPDWRESQERAVRAACSTEDMHVWVAELGDALAGFIAIRLDPPDRGEVHMEAVDPAHQRQGVGSELMDFALAWMRDRGVRLAMVETGGDLGHAPARRTYERAGFTALPIARYYKRL